MAKTYKKPENDFICKTLFHLNTIKGFHWQTESYAEHQVLDLYHNKLTELIDKFVETLKEFKPTTITQQIDIYIDKADVIEIIKEIWELFKKGELNLPPLGKAFELEQFQEALIESQKPQKKNWIFLDF